MAQVVRRGERVELLTNDVSHRGAFIRTDVTMPLGMRLQANVHTAGGTPISVEVVVRRQISEPGFTGIGVEFAEVAADQKRNLLELIRANTVDDEAIFIDPEDPGLH